MSESNSKNMTLEDKLVDYLKENRLGALIGDEDALAKLAKRAIDEALFEDRKETTGTGYNQSTKYTLSPVKQAAKEIAERAVQRVMDVTIQEVLKDPRTLQAITEAIGALFPGIVLRHLDNTARDLHAKIQIEAINKLSTAFMGVGDGATAQTIMKALQLEAYNDSKNPIIS